MEIILRPRGWGKTTELIKKCAEEGGYIVVFSREEARRVAMVAEQQCIKIPYPLTLEEAMHAYSLGVKKFHIDNAEQILQKLLPSPIATIALTEDEDKSARRFRKQFYVVPGGKIPDDSNLIGCPDLTHPKIKKLVCLAGTDAYQGLQNLLEWAIVNRPSGQLHTNDPIFIENKAGWQGYPGRFTGILLELGLLACNELEFIIPSWIGYEPSSA